MNQAVDNRHLRQVALSAFDVQMIGMLARCGGEQPWYPDRSAIEKRALAIRMMNHLRERGLIFIVSGDGAIVRTSLETTAHGRYLLRLTDEGRTVATQLAAMQVTPKVEVVNT